jgi:hypothetical protein
MIPNLASNDKENVLFSRLLDDDAKIYPSALKERRRFVAELFNDAHSRLQSFATQIFTNGHTIGDKFAVGFRTILLSAFKKEHIPWDGSNAIRSKLIEQ